MPPFYTRCQRWPDLNGIDDRAAALDCLRMIRWQCRLALERVRSGIARRVGLDVELLNSAASVDELYPGETIAGPPAIALPGQFERIRAGAFGVDVAKEVAQLQGAPRTIGPTLRYVLHNVLVNQGVIYGRGRRKFFNPAARCDQTKRAWIEYDEVALRSSFVGCHFFGHWLGDDCATHLLAEQAGKVMSMPTPPWPDRANYLAVFGQAYEELDRACVKRLILFHDISQNAHKVQRLRELRARLANETVSSAAADIVYLMRGAGEKPRPLLNEAEVVEELTRRGVRILRAETLPVPQMIAELCGARMIIGVEGSQLSHALFTLRDEGALLTIQPPDRFFNSHMDWARPLNMRYGIVVGEARPSGFYLPIGDLLRTIDLLDANWTPSAGAQKETGFCKLNW